MADRVTPGSAAARALYPITETTIFANHCAASPLSRRVTEAMSDWLNWWQLHGGRDDLERPFDAWRQNFATLIGAQPQEIAFTGNTSEGLLLVANGFPWQAGDAILTADGEFVANVYPWYQAELQGVEIIRLPLRENVLHLDQIETALRDHPNIRLVALSFVSFLTGQQLPLAALGALCHQYDAYLSIDAIQGAGAFPMDVGASQVDFLSAGGPKWLMGPIGAGFFYCREALLPMLRPRHHGWLSVDDPSRYLDYHRPLSETASRFEPGTSPWLSLVGLNASVKTLHEVGIDAIAAHISLLGDTMRQGLTARGYELALPDDVLRGGIVAFRHAERDATTIVQALDSHHVTTSAREGWIRFAPHFYNTVDEVERTLALL